MNLPRDDPLSHKVQSSIAKRLPSRGVRQEKEIEGGGVDEHATTHMGGVDALTPSGIGAAAAVHEHRPQDNLAAAAAPAVTDDESLGYEAGSEWVDLVNDKAYICLDATAGAAVWTETTGAGGGGGNTLNAAYDQGGAGSGRIITADSGAVELRHNADTALLATRDSGGGDAADRFSISRDGDLGWGSGAGAQDIALTRAAANRLAFAAGDILSVQYIADTAGNTRITTGAAPHVVISDDLQVAGVAGLKGSAINQIMMLRISPTQTIGNPSWSGVDVQPILTVDTGAGRTAFGVLGVPSIRPSGSFANINLYGLYFAGTAIDLAMAASSAAFTAITAIYATVSFVGALPGNTMTCAMMKGLDLGLLITVGGATVSCLNAKGIHLKSPNSSALVNYWGIHLEDETAATGTNYLLEIGPATPYLRLLGGGNPAANQTNLYLKEAANLRQVRWMDPGAGGANFAGGERVMILV